MSNKRKEIMIGDIQDFVKKWADNLDSLTRHIIVASWGKIDIKEDSTDRILLAIAEYNNKKAKS